MSRCPRPVWIRRHALANATPLNLAGFREVSLELDENPPSHVECLLEETILDARCVVEQCQLTHHHQEVAVGLQGAKKRAIQTTFLHERHSRWALGYCQRFSFLLTLDCHSRP